MFARPTLPAPSQSDPFDSPSGALQHPEPDLLAGLSNAVKEEIHQKPLNLIVKMNMSNEWEMQAERYAASGQVPQREQCESINLIHFGFEVSQRRAVYTAALEVAIARHPEIDNLEAELHKARLSPEYGPTG